MEPNCITSVLNPNSRGVLTSTDTPPCGQKEINIIVATQNTTYTHTEAIPEGHFDTVYYFYVISYIV